MSPDSSSDLLGALPRTRPHRRSAKRPVRATGAGSATAPEGTAEATGRTTKAAEGSTRSAPPAKVSKTTQAKAQAAKDRTPAPKQRAVARKATKPSTPRRAGARTQPLPQPAQPRGVPDTPRAPRPEPSDVPVLRTAVGAAAELAEIGVSLSTRARRRAVGRFPRP